MAISAEKALLKTSGFEKSGDTQRELFPDPPMGPKTILTGKSVKGDKRVRGVIKKVPDGNDNFYSEIFPDKGKGWAPSFKLGPLKSALGNMPADESKFPVSTWLRTLLTTGEQQFILNSLLIRKASPPGQVHGFKPDGSNLPWVIQKLKDQHPDSFKGWIKHLQTALPDIRDVRTVVREDDRHRYLVGPRGRTRCSFIGWRPMGRCVCWL